MIVSQDPMYVTFPVSQREFLRAQQSGRQPDARSIKVRIRFSDGTIYDQTGAINFVDVTVDRTTDTVIARATMPNPKGALIDGQLVSVVLEADKPGGEDRDSAGGADRRPAGRLRLRGRGRQGRGEARQARRPSGTDVVIDEG